MRLGSKYQFKLLFADALHQLSRKDGLTYVSVLCYYFIDRKVPIKPAVKHLRRARVKVTMYPGQAALPGFSNHILALRLPVKLDFFDTSDFLFCLNCLDDLLESFPMLSIGALFIKGHVVHIDQLHSFLEKYQTHARSETYPATAIVLFYYICYMAFKTHFVRSMMYARFFLNLCYWRLVSV